MDAGARNRSLGRVWNRAITLLVLRESCDTRTVADNSIDSYYTRTSPRTPSDPQLLYPQPSTNVQGFSPASPSSVDPSAIDRRGLVGVGELSTPRWASQDWKRHSRTPSMPQQEISPPMPPPANSLHVGSAPQDWAAREVGLGLGVGVGSMEKVTEESPARDARTRHHSISQSPAKPPIKPRASQTQPNTANNPDLEFASLLGSLDDFHFDSTMEAALAASLAIPDEWPESSTSPSAVTSPRNTEPLNPPNSVAHLASSVPPAGPSTASPGSARSRIYARRAEREKERDRVMAEQIVSVPPPVQSPPHSADSSSFRRDSRKTPPAKERDVRYHQSPSHDILKHFVPKDFSHLPPSPSSASINQFLRGSASTHNFATTGLATGGTPPGLSPSASYFGAPPVHRENRGSLPVSEMHKANASAWSREVDADTAEALRKLDGLGSTPGKGSRSKSKMSSGPGSAGRPGTPPKTASSASERRLTGKTSMSSVKVEGEKDSPLNNWLDLGEDVPVPAVSSPMRKPGGVTGEQYSQEKRESSSSTSVAGTPNSRDSHSLPTSSTTPSSTPGVKVAGRRGSDGSVASQDAANEKSLVETSVPPVPPLPKGYMSMRSGLSAASYQPIQDAPTEVQSPSSPGLTADRPKQMNKKWSFSSALNLKLGKESPSSATSPYAQEAIDDSRSPDAPWSEIQKSELPSPFDRRPSGQMSSSDNRSTLSTTPVAPGGYPQQPQPPPLTKTASSGSKRLGPSSIPFFRRTSSSSSNQKPQPAPIPETPKTAGLQGQASSQTGSTRKSGWGGMHLPSMLRGSASKRGLSQQAQPPIEIPAERRDAGSIGSSGSSGWTGRQRGKTLSMSADQAQAMMMPPPSATTNGNVIKPKPSVESTLSSRDSAQSNRSESTINGTARAPKTALPVIVGSPALKTAASSSSLRHDSRPHPSATPTKIPRIVSRQAEPGGSMPPPTTTSSVTAGSRTANWSARHMSNAASMNELARASITEFGTMAPRQASSGSHRAHLLQPMSTREVTRTKGPRTTDPPMRRADGSLVPPSRRTLPNPPAAAAATISSAAKRNSREFRPAGNRRESKDTTDSGDKGSRDASPIKPSKSLHAKLNLPPNSAQRISPSSSVGAPGMAGQGFRKASLKQPESGNSSPADDEEALADNEMQAYIKRRRARAATSRKDDMADVTAFPEDVNPAEPIPQRTFIKQRLPTLSDYERKEVLDYEHIFFSPTREIVRPVGANGATYNHGFDDERGDYLVVEGDHMCYRYEVGSILGKGSFGQVVQARDHKTGQSVAVKIIRNKKRFHTQALVEVKILQQLCEWVGQNDDNIDWKCKS